MYRGLLGLSVRSDSKHKPCGSRLQIWRGVRSFQKPQRRGRGPQVPTRYEFTVPVLGLKNGLTSSEGVPFASVSRNSETMTCGVRQGLRVATRSWPSGRFCMSQGTTGTLAIQRGRASFPKKNFVRAAQIVKRDMEAHRRGVPIDLFREPVAAAEPLCRAHIQPHQPSSVWPCRGVGGPVLRSRSAPPCARRAWQRRVAARLSDRDASPLNSHSLSWAGALTCPYGSKPLERQPCACR